MFLVWGPGLAWSQTQVVVAGNVQVSGNVILGGLMHYSALTWVPPTDTTNLAGYHVYRALNSAGPFNLLGSTLIPTAKFTDFTVTAGSSYWYYVKSATATGTESTTASNTVSVTVPVP